METVNAEESASHEEDLKTTQESRVKSFKNNLVNIGVISFCILLILGLLFSYWYNSQVELISQPVTLDSLNSTTPSTKIDKQENTNISSETATPNYNEELVVKE